FSFFFFFQAEDGIRDYKVTGVQTCALPISLCSWPAVSGGPGHFTPPRNCPGCEPSCARDIAGSPRAADVPVPHAWLQHNRAEERSEERRVGKECRARWSTEGEKERRIRVVR